MNQTQGKATILYKSIISIIIYYFSNGEELENSSKSVINCIS